ncbi:MAG TPA: Uma2 family endonuclease [Solirubrobacteraceae bacterium]|jgi:Uma2 family endonuclease|nr:Uma2 family endonuclease [Solirubrobacteraceae bacterium]
MATVVRTRVVHPRIETWEFDALQENAGWSMDMELIGGEAVIVPPIGGSASSVQGELYLALRRWQEDIDEEGLFLQDVFVAFPAGSRPAPDISYWSAKRRPPVERGAVQSVPDLIIEVLSPSTRANDEGAKRELYMGSGVRELWLVDPDGRTVTRVRPDAAPDEVFAEGATLRSELLEGFALDVARIFAFPECPADEGS